MRAILEFSTSILEFWRRAHRTKRKIAILSLVPHGRQFVICYSLGTWLSLCLRIPILLCGTEWSMEYGLNRLWTMVYGRVGCHM